MRCETRLARNASLAAADDAGHGSAGTCSRCRSHPLHTCRRAARASPHTDETPALRPQRPAPPCLLHLTADCMVSSTQVHRPPKLRHCCTSISRRKAQSPSGSLLRLCLSVALAGSSIARCGCVLRNLLSSASALANVCTYCVLQTWRVEEGCHWEVTRVKQKVNDGRFPDETIHGKAWGIFTWNGTLRACARRHFTRSAQVMCAAVQGRRMERSERFGAPTRKCGNT